VHGRLKAAIEALLGAPAVMFKDKINFKMAAAPGSSRIRISKAAGRPSRRYLHAWSASTRHAGKRLPGNGQTPRASPV